MKLMISQPMAGKTNEQIHTERAELVQTLELEGHTVIESVIAKSPEDAANAPLWYIAKSLELMSTCDGVVFMKGWQIARGCSVEYEVARMYNLFIRED